MLGHSVHCTLRTFRHIIN